MDGETAAAILNDLQRILLSEIVEELRTLASKDEGKSSEVRVPRADK